MIYPKLSFYRRVWRWLEHGVYSGYARGYRDGLYGLTYSDRILDVSRREYRRRCAAQPAVPIDLVGTSKYSDAYKQGYFRGMSDRSKLQGHAASSEEGAAI
jgi:hypothetical protein